MKKVILIGGDLAAGKSTYSLFLKEYFNIGLINKDILKEIIGDTIIANDRNENKKFSIICFDLIKYILQAIPTPIIIESNFKDYEMNALKEVLKDADVLSIKLIGEHKEMYERFQKRLEGNRHYVHRQIDFDSFEGFVKVQESLRNVNYIGKVIEVKVGNNILLKDDINLTNQIKNFLIN